MLYENDAILTILFRSTIVTKTFLIDDNHLSIIAMKGNVSVSVIWI